MLCDSTNYFGAVTRLPDLVIILSTKTTVFADHLAVRDAAKMLIPSVAVCDSNSDPRLVSFLVFLNSCPGLWFSIFLCILFAIC